MDNFNLYSYDLLDRKGEDLYVGCLYVCIRTVFGTQFL